MYISDLKSTATGSAQVSPQLAAMRELGNKRAWEAEGSEQHWSAFTREVERPLEGSKLPRGAWAEWLEWRARRGPLEQAS